MINKKAHLYAKWFIFQNSKSCVRFGRSSARSKYFTKFVNMWNVWNTWSKGMLINLSLITLKYFFAFLTFPPLFSNSFRLSSNVLSDLKVMFRLAGGVWISSFVAWQNKQQWRPGWNIKRWYLLRHGMLWHKKYYCFTINCLLILFLCQLNFYRLLRLCHTHCIRTHSLPSWKFVISCPWMKNKKFFGMLINFYYKNYFI